MGMVVRHDIESEEQWLEWRKADVTASRVAALFGQHPYETALHLYLEKCGVEFAQPDRDNRILRRGRWLEPAVAVAVGEKRPEWKIEAPKLYLRDPDLRLGATPDFYIHDDPRGLGVLQCKTVAPSVFERDWDSGREVPFWILLQIITEMMLAEAQVRMRRRPGGRRLRDGCRTGRGGAACRHRGQDRASGARVLG